MIDPKTFAASTLALLQEDPRRYRNFGAHWYFVKALMKRFYTRDNLHLLGEHMDQSVIDRMPAYGSLQAALAGAVEEYRQNASFELGGNVLTDGEGEQFTLIDLDAGV